MSDEKDSWVSEADPGELEERLRAERARLTELRGRL